MAKNETKMREYLQKQEEKRRQKEEKMERKRAAAAASALLTPAHKQSERQRDLAKEQRALEKAPRIKEIKSGLYLESGEQKQLLIAHNSLSSAVNSIDTLCNPHADSVSDELQTLFLTLRRDIDTFRRDRPAEVGSDNKPNLGKLVRYDFDAKTSAVIHSIDAVLEGVNLPAQQRTSLLQFKANLQNSLAPIKALQELNEQRIQEKLLTERVERRHARLGQALDETKAELERQKKQSYMPEDVKEIIAAAIDKIDNFQGVISSGNKEETQYAAEAAEMMKAVQHDIRKAVNTAGKVSFSNIKQGHVGLFFHKGDAKSVLAKLDHVLEERVRKISGAQQNLADFRKKG